MAWKKRNLRLRELAEGLVKAGALQFGTFTLPGGVDSSYYVNLSGLPSYPGVYSLAVEAISDTLTGKVPKVDAIGAAPVLGVIFGGPVAVALKKPLIYTRLERRENERLVVGEVRPGWNVVVVGDLSTSGRTVLSTAEAIEDEGGKVTSAVVLIDRLEGARERLSKKGIALHAVTDMVELADALYSMELISTENMKAITRTVGHRK